MTLSSSVTRILSGALLAAFLIVCGAPLAEAQGAYLTGTLSLDDENADVELLQTWLGTDPALYPEKTVSGTFGPATKRAVERYQEKKGIIFWVPGRDSSYGVVDPITRAGLNADFSDTQGGIAVVEGSYGDAFSWNGTAFVALEESGYSVEEEITAKLQAWANPMAFATRDMPILENGDGYSIGFTDNGKLYATTPDARATTEAAHGKAAGWQHVAVMFLPDDAVFVFDNKVVEVVPLVKKPSGFLTIIANRIADSFKAIFRTEKAVEAPALARVDSISNQNKGIFGSFFSRVGSWFGFAPQVTTPASPVAIAPPEEPVQTQPVDTEPAATTSGGATLPIITYKTVTLGPPVTSPMNIGKSSTTVTQTGNVPSTTTSTSTGTKGSSSSGGGGGGGGGSTNSAPVITLSGSASITLGAGGIYTDPGASASDKEDGDLSDEIEIGGDTVNYNIPASYRITYNVTDSNGKKATEVVRLVVVTSPPSVPVSQQQPTYSLPPAGQNVSYTISNGAGADPRFISSEISPLHVYVGETQTFSVKVASGSGIESVTSTTELDTSTLDLDLVKVSSDSSGDTYSASWVVYDTHVRTYHTTFTATNGNGDENSITMAWSDPCAGITQGTNSSLSTDCAVSDVSGLDGASATIPGGITLTINSGGTWAFNPGTTLTVNGAIVKAAGGQIRKGYLFYSGASNAAANTSAMVFSTNAAETGYVRVNQYTQGYYYGQGYYQGYYYGQGYYQATYYAELYYK